MAGEVRYCITTDGVRIAYCVEGEGTPLFFSHFFYAFSLSHIVPSFDAAIHRIARGHRFIRYDARGTGLSQREVADLSPSAMVLDIEAVVADLELEPFTMLAAAVGGPRAIEYTVRHPDRVTGLVLYETFARVQDVFPLPMTQALAGLCRANWTLAAGTFADAGVRRTNEEEGRRWVELWQQSISGETMARFLEDQAEIDVTTLLGEIKCPTLICHSRNDGLYPFALGQRMAELIPGARLVPLEEDAWGPFSDPASAIAAIDQFLPPAVTTTDQPRPSMEPVVALTPRETEILRMIAAGRTSRQIADELSLSIRTIGRHITNVYNKIGAHGRADATAYAHRHGLEAT